MYEFLGRKKITIPISFEDFQNNVEKYLIQYIDNAASQHRKNVEEIELLHKEFLGQQQILYSKKRYDM